MNTSGIGNGGKTSQGNEIPRQVRKLQKKELILGKRFKKSDKTSFSSNSRVSEESTLTETKIKLRDSYYQFFEDNLRNEAGSIFSGKTLRWKMLNFPAIAKFSMIQWIHANNLNVEISTLNFFSTYNGEVMEIALTEEELCKDLYTYFEKILANV